jgi:hypothetical protein
MNEIQSQVLSLLPLNRKLGPTGWLLYSCPVCQLVGNHRRDVKNRGQAVFSRGGFVFYCHNCHFRSGWSPGLPIGHKVTMYLEALGAESEQIQKLKLAAMRITDLPEEEQITLIPDLKPRKLPKGAKSFSYWASLPDPPEKFLQALHYLNDRNPLLLGKVDFYWTDNQVGRADGRIIIPLKFHNKIVGSSSRWFDGPTDGRPKYVNDIPTGFMYNVELLNDPYRKYVVLVEGALDAAVVDGIGILKNRVTDKQLLWLNEVDKKKIVLPDRDAAGGVMIDQAIEHGWMVSFPNWDSDIKDPEEATRRYGRVYTVNSILRNAVEGEMMIGVRRKQWQ